jgi:hypothetical protein
VQPCVFCMPSPGRKPYSCASTHCSLLNTYLQVVDVSEGTPQLMKYPRKGSFEVTYMLREEGRTFAKEVPKYLVS